MSAGCNDLEKNLRGKNGGSAGGEEAARVPWRRPEENRQTAQDCKKAVNVVDL